MMACCGRVTMVKCLFISRGLIFNASFLLLGFVTHCYVLVRSSLFFDGTFLGVSKVI